MPPFSRPNDPFDIRRFHAACDSNGIGGGTDDTAAIQATIAACSAAGSGSGRTVIIPGFTRCKPFVVGKNMRFVGVNNAESGREASSALIFDDYDPNVFTKAGLIVAQGGSDGTSTGSGRYTEIDSVLIRMASASSFNTAVKRKHSEAGIVVGTVRLPPASTKHGYALRCSAITTGTTGTSHVTMPTHNPLTSRITATSGSGVNPTVITTDEPHNIVNGSSRTIRNCTGNTAANGTFVCTVTGEYTFTIPVASNGTYAGGGWVGPLAITDGGVTWIPFEYHAVWARGAVRIRNSCFAGFPGNQLYIQAQVGSTPFTDASFSRVYDTRLEGGGNGSSVWGNDANACLFSGVQYVSNAGDSFDNALAGNTYIQCGWHNCGGTIESNNASFIDCYIEGGMPPVVLLSGSGWSGGSIPGAVDRDGNTAARVAGIYENRAPYANWAAVPSGADAVFVGDMVKGGNGFVYRCVRANGSTTVGAPGTKGGAEPSWYPGYAWLQGDISDTDGNLVWECWAKDITSGWGKLGDDVPTEFENFFGTVGTKFVAAGRSANSTLPYAFWWGPNTKGTFDGGSGVGMYADTADNTWRFRYNDATDSFLITMGGHSRGGGIAGFINGVLLSNGSLPGSTIKVQPSNAAPGSGTWAHGDQIPNSSPAAGDVDKWFRTSGGAWEPFYGRLRAIVEVGDAAHTAALATAHIVFKTALTANRAVTLPALSTVPIDFAFQVTDFTLTAANVIQVTPNGTDKINNSNTTQTLITCGTAPTWKFVRKLSNALGWVVEG